MTQTYRDDMGRLEAAHNFRAPEVYDAEFGDNVTGKQAYFRDKVAALGGVVQNALRDDDRTELTMLQEVIGDAERAVDGVLDHSVLDNLRKQREQVKTALERAESKPERKNS